MKWLCVALAFAALVSMTGCAMVASPTFGTIYTGVKYPGAHTPQGAVPGPKTGIAEAQNILGIVATGDASVQAAARSAGITRIATVEHEATAILGIWAKFTTKVTGD